MSQFTFDHHGGDAVPRIALGDLLRWPNVVHRVIGLREVDSRQWPDRWKIETERLGPVPKGAQAENVATWSAWANESLNRYGRCRTVRVERYGRGEGPRDHRCEIPECEGCEA